MRMRATLGLLLLLAACATLRRPPLGPATLEEAAALTPPGQARASIHLTARAAAARDTGDLGTGRELASQALRLDGRNAYAYFLLGEVAGASGEHDAALRYLDQARVLFEAAEPPNEVWLARTLRLQAELLEDTGQPERAAPLREEAEAIETGQGRPGRVLTPVIDSAQ